MKFKFSFGAVLALALFASANVFALTCKNDYSSASGCAENTNAAGDCSTLGYTKNNTANCSHYIYCPFDSSYKRCTDCNAGYVLQNDTCVKH